MEERRQILMEKFEIGRLLGQGTFAKVYYARNLITGQAVAIKMINKDKVMKVGLIEQIKREISVMRLVKHPNIVELYEVLASKAKIYFILEYARGGELFRKVSKGKLSEEVARKYFRQLISAVDYCHSRGVYHRDLKPENLLLDENENLKVSDFGLSALADSRRQDGLLHTTCGTPAYVAPEVINRCGYDGVKADIWSCGVILFVLVAGYLPFHDRNLIEMYRKICKGEFRCPSWFSPELRRLIFKILDPDASTRISIASIKVSSWYKKPVDDNPIRTEPAEKEKVPNDQSSASTSLTSSVMDGSRENGELTDFRSMNAFDIISFSTGFDLSGLFNDSYGRKETRFTSKQPAAAIFSKLIELAKKLKLKIKKEDNGFVKMAGTKEGRKGILEINAEIYEVNPSFHMVELQKINGDTLEYEKLLKEDIRPGLNEIVWTWQDDPQNQQPS